MGVGLMGGAHGGWTDDKKGYMEPGEGDGISFQPVDPISKLELVDPCLASDGYIHDRWTVRFLSLFSSFELSTDLRFSSSSDHHEPTGTPSSTWSTAPDPRRCRPASFSHFPEVSLILDLPSPRSGN